MDLNTEARQLVAHISQQREQGVPAGQLRRTLFGKDGSFTTLLQTISSLPKDERPAAQAELRLIRTELEQLLLSTEKGPDSLLGVDTSLPGILPQLGTIHPISAMIEHMVDIFSRLSFEIVEGQEIVGEEENFDLLNIGPDHPARDGHDSYFLSKNRLLRTQTTAVQVIELRRRQKAGLLPVRIVVPGKTYRRESDPTHSPMFHQFDAVLVDTTTSFSDLRGCLDFLVTELFGDLVETRFRPHHFPFTEPSAELDIRWRTTDPSNSLGKHTEWLEMGGCGMIHPDVLRHAGINPSLYRGWAFGMSIERPVMVKYGVPDLRSLYENNLSFLQQFPTI